MLAENLQRWAAQERQQGREEAREEARLAAEAEAREKNIQLVLKLARLGLPDQQIAQVLEMTQEDVLAIKREHQ